MTDEKDPKAESEDSARASEKGGKGIEATEVTMDASGGHIAKTTVSDEPTTLKEDSSDDSGEVEVPKEFQKLVEQVESMSVLELNELVKVLEKKFGVSAAAVAVAGVAAEAGADEEQDSFTVELAAVGEQKIAVIKAIKEITGLGLKEAKDLVEGAPQVVKEGVKKEEADELKAKLEEAGAQVTLK